MAFTQDPPRFTVHPYDDDFVLRDFLQRVLPREVRLDVEPSLREMGDLAKGPLLSLLEGDRAAVPVLTQWDAWGNRVDRIALTPLWQAAARVAAEKGLVATAYERKHGQNSRLHQMALVYLFDASTAVYTCPLAMTDGAAKTLQLSGNRVLIERAIPRLTSRDPETAWTSGQWMTEKTGGSDVGTSETVARLDAQGWRLWGTPRLAALPGTALRLPELPWFPNPSDPPDGPRAGASAPAQAAGRSHVPATIPRAEIRLMVLE
jgi:hypothetical protein